jgi:hypothetical protein
LDVGLDIWFAEDIRNALLAANEASAATVAVIAEMGAGPSTSSRQPMADSINLATARLRAYREGYKAALATLALAFGIAPQAIALRQAQDEALHSLDGAEDGPLGELDRQNLWARRATRRSHPSVTQKERAEERL